ncbi:MAG: SLC13 family permease, partial [Pseudomonadota bacterium]|nr:SLC13 family permease [Pseudomonadota bacterium]
ATLLFLWPRNWRRGEFVLNWREAEALPWGVLILFGGGLSLAAAVQSSGLAEWLGAAITDIDGVTVVGLLVASAITIVLLTELTSNTATTAVFLPVLASAALLSGQNPLLLAVPATLAASCAFMMPVATPPNAIVFSSGRITIPQMAWAGVWMNLVAVILLLTLTRFWIMPVFDIEPHQVPEWASASRPQN